MYSSSTVMENTILVIMAIVVIALFLGALYAFLVAIFQFIFSKWDWEKIKKAWNNIRYMILWIILSFLLLFIFPIVFQRLEVPGHEAYNAQNIFNKASEIIQKVIYWESINTPYGSSSSGGRL